jgi:hypothetical protein
MAIRRNPFSGLSSRQGNNQIRSRPRLPEPEKALLEVFGSSGIGSPNASNPRGESRYMSDQFFASSFVLSMIRFQWLAPKPYCGTVLLTRFALFASQKAHILPNRDKDRRAMALR